MDAHDQQGVTHVVDAVVIDFAANAIHLQVPGYPGAADRAMPALLDVGGNGRLIGLEMGERYISVMDVPGAEEPYVRSAEVLVEVTAGSPPWITVPRRGNGYEITYPSGNECWQMKSVGGELIQVCAVRATIDAAPSALRDARGRWTTPGRH